MYRVVKYVIKPDHKLHSYCSEMCHLSCNLYNASLFRIRQILTVFKKDCPTPNELGVLNEIRKALPGMNQTREAANQKRIEKAKNKNTVPVITKPFVMPDKEHSFLDTAFLDALFKETDNPDYVSGLPMHGVQAVIKRAHEDVKNYFSALRDYKLHPEKYKAMPKIPGYKKKGGMTQTVFSNQECYIKNQYLKLPKTKTKYYLGNYLPETFQLKQVEISPFYDCFRITLVLENSIKTDEKISTDKMERIAAIDFGVDNIAAIANNIDLPGLLFKGGKIKAANQWFNKRRAQIVHGITIGHPTLTNPTSKSLYRLSRWRNGFMSTELHTIAKKIISWCVKNNIETLVLGYDPDWKDGAHIGKENNQNFVSIPFCNLRWYLTYLGENAGINIIKREESYTSKASFVDMDDIPVFEKGKEMDKQTFSGYRKKRGQYKLKNRNIVLNADLNGAGNILRKAFPDAFQNQREYRFLNEIVVM